MPRHRKIQEEESPFAAAPGGGTGGAPAPTPKRPMMKARPNWDDMSAEEAGPDRLKLPSDVVDKLRRDHGMDVQWVTSEIYGQPQPQRRAQFEKKGWTPVHQEDFGGMLDGLFMRKGDDGEINMEGLVLMARPMEISEKARDRERKSARMPLQIKEQQIHGRDLPGVSGADHPTVRNSIQRSRERISIPDE